MNIEIKNKSRKILNNKKERISKTFYKLHGDKLNDDVYEMYVYFSYCNQDECVFVFINTNNIKLNTILKTTNYTVDTLLYIGSFEQTFVKIFSKNINIYLNNEDPNKPNIEFQSYIIDDIITDDQLHDVDEFCKNETDMSFMDPSGSLNCLFKIAFRSNNYLTGFE